MLHKPLTPEQRIAAARKRERLERLQQRRADTYQPRVLALLDDPSTDPDDCDTDSFVQARRPVLRGDWILAEYINHKGERVKAWFQRQGYLVPPAEVAVELDALLKHPPLAIYQSRPDAPDPEDEA